MASKIIFFAHRLRQLAAVFGVLAMVACSNSELPTELQGLCAPQQSDKTTCSYDTELGVLTLFSSIPSMPFETPITLTLELPEDVIVSASEIRGLSMYMGRIPVVWQEQADGTWQARILLGACTDPQMVWQLQINLVHKHSEQHTRVLIPFQSNWD